MKTLIFKSSVLVSLLVLTILPNSLNAQSDSSLSVFVFEIMDEISKPALRVTQKAIEEASERDVDYIILHLNTYGGRVDIADSIRTRIINSSIPVFAFIDNQAISAGSLISIACDSIYMHPGANIGAATVVDQSGKPLPDKYQSYMRSMMRSTAEASGRDPEIAQAMVDPRIYIEGISDTGHVLTFTAREAVKFKFCEGIAESVDEVLELANIEEYTIVEQKLTFTDKIIKLLINPFVSGILIMVIIGGIYFEMQTPGIGFPIAASVLAAVVYFMPLYIEGLAENWEIIIFIVGVILIAVEIFAIPGFGVPGILGIIMVVAGLTLSMTGNIGFDFTGIEITGLVKSFFIVIIAMFLSILLSFYFGRKILTTTTFGHLALDSIQDKKEGFTSSSNAYEKMIGKTGIAFTVLRPAGKVKVGDEIFDASAEAGYIEKGDTIKVTDYQTSQLFVVKVNS